MGRMAVNPLAAAAVVSRSSFLPPSFGTLWSRNPERPADGLDRTGRAANTDVNCIPSRGKSQFCLESAMSEGEGRASSESNHLARSSSSLEQRSWQCKSFSLSSAAATDHASIFNHFADGGAEFENLDSNIDGIERRNGGGVFNSFVVVGCRAFLHPSFHRISPSSFLPSFLPSAPLIPDISLSLPLTLKAVIDRQMMPPPPPLPSARWVLRQK